MGEVLGQVVPLGLAVAASPLTIIPAILLLLTDRPRSTSAAYLAGWLLGIGVSTTVFVLVSSFIASHDETPTWASWTRIALGLVLVVLGVRQWLDRRTPKPAPKWMASVSAATPARAFRLAIVLAIANPKVLLLSAAAGLAIGAAELPTQQTVAAGLAFTAIAAVSVALPVVLYLALGDRMVATLTRARDWLERNNSAVMAVVLIVIGLALIAKGLSAVA